MTNEEKFKTAYERVMAFNRKCGPCEVVNCDRVKAIGCYNNWLALPVEEEEKPEPCPFCNKMTFVGGRKVHFVYCLNDLCGYSGPTRIEKAKAIAEHNRVARAVRAAKKGEAK